jgi:hypothetical protein
MALSFERQATSKKLLEIAWDFPETLDVREADDGKTRASARMFKLSREAALARLTAGDDRPLLVLRECNVCKGSDDALLSRKLDNERTQLLTRWFHCVKFKPNVMFDENHTFHALFDGKPAPHLFVCRADGSQMVLLGGRVPQGEIWDAMLGVLSSHYERDAEEAVKSILELMARFDHLDAMELQYKEQIDAEIEARGPKSSKLRRLREKLAKLDAEREALRARQQKLEDLGKRSD